MCEVICPYCYESNDTERVYEYEEDCLELECEHCGKIMSISLFPEPYAARLPFGTCLKCGQEARADEILDGICLDCRKAAEEKKIKEADKYLSQVKKIDNLINAELEQAEKIRAQAEKVNMIFGEKVRGSYSDKVNNNGSRLIQMDIDINKRIDTLCDLKEQINATINCISDNDYKILLKEYYLNGKTMEDIAEILGRESRYTYKLRKKALLAFEKDSKRHVMTVY